MNKVMSGTAHGSAATAAVVAPDHAPASAQAVAPTLRAGTISSAIVIDGQLSETAWESADTTDDFHQTDPVEGVTVRFTVSGSDSTGM